MFTLLMNWWEWIEMWKCWLWIVTLVMIWAWQCWICLLSLIWECLKWMIIPFVMWMKWNWLDWRDWRELWSETVVLEVVLQQWEEIISIWRIVRSWENWRLAVIPSLKLRSDSEGMKWWIDLPSLKSLLLGRQAFQYCSRIVLESEWTEKRMMNRFAWINLHSTWWECLLFWWWWIKWIDHAKCILWKEMMNRLA